MNASPRILKIAALVAVLAAAAPHFFFEPSLILHMRGEMDAWIGIAVWAPAILASVAFFFGVEFGARKELTRPIDPMKRAFIVLVAALVGIVICAAATTERWSGMSDLMPPDLHLALGLFSALGVLRALFYQGFLQHRVLTSFAPGARVAVLLAAELLVVLPFALQANPHDAVGMLLLFGAVEGLVAALAYEVGYSVRVAIALRALYGFAFVWFQQAYLL